MPYKNKKDVSKEAQSVIEAMDKITELKPGDVNLMISWLFRRQLQLNGERYDSMSDCIKEGVSAVLEFYRVVLGPYEDKWRLTKNKNIYNPYSSLESDPLEPPFSFKPFKDNQ